MEYRKTSSLRTDKPKPKRKGNNSKLRVDMKSNPSYNNLTEKHYLTSSSQTELINLIGR